jgi:hypothetical protein
MNDVLFHICLLKSFDYKWTYQTLFFLNQLYHALAKKSTACGTSGNKNTRFKRTECLGDKLQFIGGGGEGMRASGGKPFEKGLSENFQ